MPETDGALEAGRLKELNIRDENGIKVIQGQATTGMRSFYGQDTLPVIMSSTRVAYLVMLDAHIKYHPGRDDYNYGHFLSRGMDCKGKEAS